MAEKIKKRSEVELKDTWMTTDLYENDDAWRADFEVVKGMESRLKSYEGRLAESAATLHGYLQLRDEYDILVDRAYHYTSLKHDEDTKNPNYQALNGLIRSELVRISSAYSYEKPEIIAIPDDVLGGFYKDVPELGLYGRHLDIIRKQKEHTLSEKEESLLAMTGNMSMAPTNVMGMLSDADLKFPSIKDGDGEEMPVTEETYITYMENTDRRIRKDAYESLYTVYGQFENTFAALLDAQVKQMSFYAKARKFNSALEAALCYTEVPVEVYHTLISTVNENTHLLHKYVSLRKKLLGYDELRYYDLYVPVVKMEDVKFTYEQAKQQVLQALAPLGEGYVGIVKRGFDERWVDVYENENKRSGAYSAGAKVHPFVLMNYKDNLDNVLTLAHEMGHAVHSYLSNKNQPTVYSDYMIFVAEVASTCNEALLIRHMLNNCKDKTERAYLINHFLEGFRGTMYRQTMFAEFEFFINQTCEKGETLTAEALSNAYRDLNTKYYGENITIDDHICKEWARIPHFYYNFYVYQYATGYCAAIALSERILKEGKPAVDSYIEFLSSGCSADPITLLKKAGVDMGTEEPIKMALKLFGELIDEMGEILGD